MAMNILQKYWLYSVLTFFSFHLIRDLAQDIGFENLITTALTKQSDVPWWYWTIFSNSYVIEVAIIILSVVSLRKNAFGLRGKLTIFLTLYFVVAWLVYWFAF